MPMKWVENKKMIIKVDVIVWTKFAKYVMIKVQLPIPKAQGLFQMKIGILIVMKGVY